MTKITEYKRKCKECGKVWHSLQSRELQIQQQINSANRASTTAACGMCAGHWSALGASEQAKRNLAAAQSELDRLRICPKCGSHNYTETETSFDESKKK